MDKLDIKENLPLKREEKGNLAVYDPEREPTGNPNVIRRKVISKTIVPLGGDIDRGMQMDQARIRGYTAMLKNKGDVE